MKAFWWFKENEVAGMARPGFNGSHWLNLPFEEALVFGWLGQRISSTHRIASLQKQISDDGPKIASFHDVDEAITFKLSQARLKWEIDYLKKQKIQTLVTLTEKHNQKEQLQDHS